MCQSIGMRTSRARYWKFLLLLGVTSINGYPGQQDGELQTTAKYEEMWIESNVHTNKPITQQLLGPLKPGSDLSLTCYYVGPVQGTLTWSEQGIQLPLSEEGTEDYNEGTNVMSHATYTVGKVSSSDCGRRFTCSADVGGDIQMSESVELEVVDLKIATNGTAVRDGVQSVTRGDTLTLNCSAYGYRVMNLIWLAQKVGGNNSMEEIGGGKETSQSHMKSSEVVWQTGELQAGDWEVTCNMTDSDIQKTFNVTIEEPQNTAVDNAATAILATATRMVTTPAVLALLAFNRLH